MAKEGRGRLSSLRLLPREVSYVVQWASDELQANNRTQVDIYREFVDRLEAAQRERRGELEFAIPSFSSFNRYSMAIEADARDLAEAREMAKATAESLDAQESDNLTLIAAENLKALIYKLSRKLRDQIDPKSLNQLSSALHRALMAQNVSTERRQKVESEYKAQAEKIIDTVAREKGMSAETIAQLRRDFLGVRPKDKGAA